ncbi:hypothetical protein ACTA71_006093 [Dictyostelium dimigraforme]
MIYNCFPYDQKLKEKKYQEYFNQLLILKGCKIKVTKDKYSKAIKTIKSLFEEKLKEIQSINGNIDYILVLPGHRIGYSSFQYSINKFYNAVVSGGGGGGGGKQDQEETNLEIKKKILYVKRVKQNEQQKKEEFRSKLSDQEEISSILFPMELNNKIILEGKSILLLDDVTTTGRTLKIYEKYFKKLINNNIKIIKFAITKTN